MLIEWIQQLHTPNEGNKFLLNKQNGEAHKYL